VAGELVFDGGDAVLADAECVVAAEGKGRMRGVEMQVGDGHQAGEARDFDGLCAGVLVGVALEDPGLVEGVHGAPLGFAVDAEVVGDVGVDAGAVDVPLVLGVGDGDEEVATAGVWDEDAGVDPEGGHDVLTVVVEVGEVGEVAGVVDGDGVAGLLKKANEFIGPSSLLIHWYFVVLDHKRLRLFCINDRHDGLRRKGCRSGDECRSVFEPVGGEAVKNVGEALGFGVFGGERVGAVATGDPCSERSNDAFGCKAGKTRGFIEKYNLRLVDTVGAEVEILPGLGCGEWGARVDGGGIFELLILAGEVADDADGGIDGTHGPARKAVEALPVGAEDALA